MNKLFLHGALGERFGEVWDINAANPAEAIRALFANEPLIEKYLNKKQKDGVAYGIKKEPDGEFLNREEAPLGTSKNLHMFPIPEGEGLGALIMTAASVAASIYISKKLAEAMERDDDVSTQTQAYIYNGQSNRQEQGSPVPVGYGRVRVGSNSISSSVLNYDFNSEYNQVINFKSGLYSLIPSYSKYYIPSEGPLASAALLSAFDGTSQFRMTDPSFAGLQLTREENFFGTREALYGPIENRDAQQRKYTNASVKGNWLAGYFMYEWDYFVGTNVNYLPNAVRWREGVEGSEGGNWYPNRMISPGGAFPYGVSGADAQHSAFVVLQSTPKLETNTEEPFFYPISFADGGLDYIGGDTATSPSPNGIFPITVGQRFRGGNKKNGAGWFKLESAGIHKSIDLIGEGPIEGFSDKNGNTLPFKKNIQNPTWEIVDVRTKDDDFLRGVYLDNTPVKEVLNLGGLRPEDAYNINEFDIDVGQNIDGLMGTEDQLLLEPQYLFTATTKEVAKGLFGPRNSSADTISAFVNPDDFKPNHPYPRGTVVAYNDGTTEYDYVVKTDLDNPFNSGSRYVSGDITYLQDDDAAWDAPSQFYRVTDAIGQFRLFSGQGTYVNQEQILGFDDVGRTTYYSATNEIGRFKGEYVSEADSATWAQDDFFFRSVGGANVLGAARSSEAGGLMWLSGTRPLGARIDEWAKPASVKVAVGDPTMVGAQERTVTVPSFVLAAQNQPWGSPLLEEYQPQVDLNNAIYFEKINIVSPTNVTVGGQADIALAERLFAEFDETAAARVRRGSEEQYISHTIINPLVQEAYVSLQVDELSYTHAGDQLNVTYKLGAFWALVFALLGARDLIKAGIKQAAVAARTTTITAAILSNAGTIDPAAKVSIFEALTVQEADNLPKTATAMVLAATLTVLKTALLIYVAGKWWKVGQKIENSGELWPNRARFRIKYGNEGETPYNTDVYIYGVATSPYRKDVKVYLPPNVAQKSRTIKVYRLNYQRDVVKEGEQAARYKEAMSFASVTEIVPVKLNYPNSVVIGTRVNAVDVPSVPERTYQLKLKKVAVPNNYDAETKRYFGMWDGRFFGQNNFTDKVPATQKYWTDNPAWCLYDLITSKRYGAGKFGIKSENVDKWTLYKIAKYCDEQIPTGYSPKYPKRKFQRQGGGIVKITESGFGSATFNTEFTYEGSQLALFYDDGTYESIEIASYSVSAKTITLKYNPGSESGTCAVSIDYPLLEPRYTLNAMLLKAENAFKLINEFAAIFRAYSYWSGGTINFFQDEEKDPVMLFSNNNISNAGFRYTSTARTNRTNSCTIKYIDRYNEFRPKMEYSADSKSIRENNIIEKTIDGFGITSPAQAKRASEFVVKTANLETEIIEFETNVAGSYLRPGDVIDVVDSKRTVGRFAGKILDVHISGDGKNAEIDIDFPIRTTIDPNDSANWKRINLYNLSGNQTVDSLNYLASRGFAVDDDDIDDLRASQIAQFWVTGISHNDTRLHLTNNAYSFIPGEFTWASALADARSRGGILGTVANETDQGSVGAVLPTGQIAWIGGLHIENPRPDRFIWYQPQACDSDDINYFNWADGFPKVGDPLETDASDPLITDVGDLNISSDSAEGFGNYLAVSGSSVEGDHGGWVTLSGDTQMGYIFEKQSDNRLMGLDGVQGTTFALEDSVNFATPETYKVANISEASVGTFKIQGVQYNKDKFGNIEKNTSITPPKSPLIFTEDILDAPTNVSLTVIGTNIFGLMATWDKVSGATGYKIQFFNGTTLLASFEEEADTNESITTQSFSYNGSNIIEGEGYFARVYSLVR